MINKNNVGRSWGVKWIVYIVERETSSDGMREDSLTRFCCIIGSAAYADGSTLGMEAEKPSMCNNANRC